MRVDLQKWTPERSSTADVGQLQVSSYKYDSLCMSWCLPNLEEHQLLTVDCLSPDPPGWGIYRKQQDNMLKITRV